MSGTGAGLRGAAAIVGVADAVSPTGELEGSLAVVGHGTAGREECNAWRVASRSVLFMWLWLQRTQV